MSDLDANATGGAVPAWRERKNLLLAGAVGVAILLLGAYFLLFSGSGGDEDLGPVASAAGAAGAAGAGGAAASPSASASPAQTLPKEESDGDVYGDPFAPLYPAVATAAAAVTPAASTVPVDTGSGVGGGTGSVPQTAAPQTEQPAPASSVSVRLVRIVDENTVVVRVNGKSPQTAEKGAEFGGYFALKSTRPDENEATFAYGSEDFTLVVGEMQKF